MLARAIGWVALSLVVGCTTNPPASETISSLATCNDPAPSPSAIIEMPGNPFQALPTSDGCWIFVSIAGGPRGGGGVAVVRRIGGTFKTMRTIRLGGNPTGMVLTHHDSLLVVAAGDRISFIDATNAESGHSRQVLGEIVDAKPAPERIYAAATPDGATLFISDERAESITVIDLLKAMSKGFGRSSIVGRIPVGNAPVGLAITADGRRLYSTSQAVPISRNWSAVCKPEGGAGPSAMHSQGAVFVIDIGRASVDPLHSVESVVPAGCNPVRIVLTPLGDRAYVSSRGTDQLLLFDVGALVTDPTHALIGQVTVGSAPVGIAVVDSGRRVVVTSSNRFASPTAPQDLTVVDVTRVGAEAMAVVGSVAAGAFPREVRLTADGQTLLVTNFNSQTLQVLDVTRLPISPGARRERSIQ